MTFVKANGLVIHYVDGGRRDGPPIVFIMRSAAIYASGPRLLRSSRPSFASSPTTSAATAYPKSGPDKCEMADYAADLMGLVDSVGVERVTIVGLSIGGVIAQELYRQRPERVAALTLCDTAAKIGTDESWDQRIAQVERGGVEEIAGSVLERWFTADFRASRAAELAGVRAMLTRTPRQAISPLAAP